MTTAPAAPTALVDAYLERLGAEREAPSVNALTRLHRAHVEAVPYETVWLHLREGWGIDPAESFERIATTRRGGYCFQLNGAFATLLTALGYHVTVHSGAVHDVGGPTTMTLGNHACLVVHDLRTAANPGGRWYVDAGLGDAIHAPLPLITGDHFDRAFRFSLVDLGQGRWQFAHDRRGTFAGMRFSEGRAEIGAFSARHRFNATSPDSTFAETVTVQRRHADGSDVLRGCVLTRTTTDGATRTVAACLDDWLALLADVFDLHIDVPRADLGELWTRLRSKHEAWALARLDGDLFAKAC